MKHVTNLSASVEKQIKGNENMSKVKYFLVFCILIMSQAANAFDDNRDGFVIGLGAGFHTIDIDFNYSGSNIGSDSESGLATSFKIGWGITNQFLLYYVRNASWYSAPYYDGFTTSDITYTVGIGGVGATYYLSPSAPSGYLLGAIGVGDISAPFESDVESDTGSALMFGGGYEVSEHIHLEATLLTTDIDSAYDSRLNLKTSSIQFTVNYLWY